MATHSSALSVPMRRSELMKQPFFSPHPAAGRTRSGLEIFSSRSLASRHSSRSPITPLGSVLPDGSP